MKLRQAEIAMIAQSRAVEMENRALFMALANEVCDLTGVPFSKICGATRGSAEVCTARDFICRIAFDRGFHPSVIARYIRRDRTTVAHSIGRRKAGE